jgi:hypothetical protein
MKLKLVREFFTPTETMGSLLIDGKFFCYTLEDKDRGLNQTDSIEAIRAKKVKGQTCIPYGKYKVQVTPSNRFKRDMTAILNVPGFEGIRMHGGNTHLDSEGCPLIARQRNLNKVHPVVKKITNWVYGSEDARLVKLLGKGVHEIEIVKRNG